MTTADRPRRVRSRLALLAVAAAAMACGPAPERPQLVALDESTTVPPEPEATTKQPASTAAFAPPTTTEAPAETGFPVAADDPIELAAQIVAAEGAIADPTTTPSGLAEAGHLQQVVYRRLAREEGWIATVLDAVPDDLDPKVRLHVEARHAFRSMWGDNPGPTSVPAWRIVEPLPAEQLLAYYVEAEQTFGVGWEYLAAVHLVETGLGRIVGLSTAGATGPMQFMPATWEQYGNGGDIWDTHDAILAAARMLSANGAPADWDNALWRYNNHTGYVQGVTAYATLLEQDPSAFRGLYHWQIYYAAAQAELLLEVGYEETERQPVEDWLAANPTAWTTPTTAAAQGQVWAGPSS